MEVADAQGVPEGYKAYRIYNAANALAVENPGSGNMTANEGVGSPAKVYCIGEHTKGGHTGGVIRALGEDGASWNDAQSAGTKIANHSYDDEGSIWEFEKAEITDGKKPYATLPGSYEENNRVEELTVTMVDKGYHLTVELHYYVFAEQDIIVQERT
jgi:hypothetical protein